MPQLSRAGLHLAQAGPSPARRDCMLCCVSWRWATRCASSSLHASSSHPLLVAPIHSPATNCTCPCSCWRCVNLRRLSCNRNSVSTARPAVHNRQLTQRHLQHSGRHSQLRQELRRHDSGGKSRCVVCVCNATLMLMLLIECGMLAGCAWRQPSAITPSGDGGLCKHARPCPYPQANTCDCCVSRR